MTNGFHPHKKSQVATSVSEKSKFEVLVKSVPADQPAPAKEEPVCSSQSKVSTGRKG